MDEDFSKAERNQRGRHTDLIEIWKGPRDQLKEKAENERIAVETNYLAAVRTWLSIANPWDNHERAKEQRKMNLGKCMPLTIVIDAFDECDQDKSPALIRHLNEVLRQSPDHVKILISTRPFPSIEGDLNTNPAIEVNVERNRSDVSEFIEATIEDRIKDKSLLNGIIEPYLKERIKDTVTKRARSMFLYASLLLNQLCDRHHTNDAESISKKLDELPRDLAEMYNRIMADIHDDKNNSERSCRLAQNTFKWLLRAQRTLDYTSLLGAVSPPERKAELEEVLRACRTLVVKESETIGFAHYSVREHVIQMEQYSPSKYNVVATRSCLRILNAFYGADETTRHELSGPQISFKDYALVYWPLHYEGIAQADITEHRAEINTMLRSFLLKAQAIDTNTRIGCMTRRKWSNLWKTISILLQN